MDNPPPIASFIMPVFNTEKRLLTASINSVLNQTVQDLELVIVDDGSRQQTADQLDKISSQDKRIKVIHKKNAGVSSARNTGLDSATGKYVAFIDADDYYESSFLEESLQILNESGADVVFGGIKQIRLDGTNQILNIQNCPNDKDFIVINEDQLDYLKVSLFDSKILHEIGLKEATYYGNYSALFNKSILNNIRFDETIAISEDRFFNWEVFDNSTSVALTNKCWYCYVLNAASASHIVRPHAISELSTTAKKIEQLKETVPAELSNNMDTGIYECFIQAVEFAAMRKDFSKFYEISKREFIKTLINVPVFKRMFQNIKPERQTQKALCTLAQKGYPLMIVFAFDVMKMASNLNRSKASANS